MARVPQNPQQRPDKAAHIWNPSAEGSQAHWPASLANPWAEHLSTGTYIHTQYTWQYILTHGHTHTHALQTYIVVAVYNLIFLLLHGAVFPSKPQRSANAGLPQSMWVFRPGSPGGPLWLDPTCKSLLSFPAPWWSARSSITWGCWNRLSKGDTAHCSVLPPTTLRMESNESADPVSMWEVN